MPIVYIIFIILTAYFSYRYDGIEENDSHKNHRFWFLCIYLICLSGFSYALGGDKQVYMNNFEIMDKDLSFVDNMYFGMIFQGYMPAWSTSMLFIKRLFDSFYAVQIFHAIIVNVCICYIVKKYTQRLFIFFILYFLWMYFIFNTEVMREALAICYCLFAMEAYMNGDKKIYVILIVFGILFHISAFIVLIFPFVKFNISWKTLAFALIISFLAWFFSGFVLSKIILTVLGSAGALAHKITHYGMISSTFFGYIRNVVTYLILPYIIMYFSYTIEKSDTVKIRKQKIMSFFILIAILAVAATPLARFRNYIQVYYLIMFADFTYQLLKEKKHLILRAGTFFLTLYLIFLSHMVYIESTKTRFYQYYVPYTSIFNEDVNVKNLRILMHNSTASQEATDKNRREIKE